MKTFYLNAAVGALVIGLMAGPAYAIDVGGGVGGGGSSDNDSSGSSSRGGGVSATATVGGKGNVASGSANVGGNKANVDVGKGSGPLVSGSQDGNPLAGTSNTDVDVNLGGFGKLFNGHKGGNGGGMTAGEVETAFDSLSGAEQQELKVTCGAVLNSPNRYDAGLVNL
jgi:hypothetical protein